MPSDTATDSALVDGAIEESCGGDTLIADLGKQFRGAVRARSSSMGIEADSLDAIDDWMRDSVQDSLAGYIEFFEPRNRSEATPEGAGEGEIEDTDWSPTAEFVDDVLTYMYPPPTVAGKSEARSQEALADRVRSYEKLTAEVQLEMFKARAVEHVKRLVLIHERLQQADVPIPETLNPQIMLAKLEQEAQRLTEAIAKEKKEEEEQKNQEALAEKTEEEEGQVLPPESDEDEGCSSDATLDETTRIERREAVEVEAKALGRNARQALEDEDLRENREDFLDQTKGETCGGDNQCDVDPCTCPPGFGFYEMLIKDYDLKTYAVKPKDTLAKIAGRELRDQTAAPYILRLNVDLLTSQGVEENEEGLNKPLETPLTLTLPPLDYELDTAGEEQGGETGEETEDDTDQEASPNEDDTDQESPDIDEGEAGEGEDCACDGGDLEAFFEASEVVGEEQGTNQTAELETRFVQIHYKAVGGEGYEAVEVSVDIESSATREETLLAAKTETGIPPETECVAWEDGDTLDNAEVVVSGDETTATTNGEDEESQSADMEENPTFICPPCEQSELDAQYEYQEPEGDSESQDVEASLESSDDSPVLLDRASDWLAQVGSFGEARTEESPDIEISADTDLMSASCEVVSIRAMTDAAAIEVATVAGFLKSPQMVSRAVAETSDEEHSELAGAIGKVDDELKFSEDKYNTMVGALLRAEETISGRFAKANTELMPLAEALAADEDTWLGRLLVLVTDDVQAKWATFSSEWISESTAIQAEISAWLTQQVMESAEKQVNMSEEDKQAEKQRSDSVMEKVTTLTMGLVDLSSMLTIHFGSAPELHHRDWTQTDTTKTRVEEATANSHARAVALQDGVPGPSGSDIFDELAPVADEVPAVEEMTSGDEEGTKEVVEEDPGVEDSFGVVLEKRSASDIAYVEIEGLATYVDDAVQEVCSARKDGDRNEIRALIDEVNELVQEVTTAKATYDSEVEAFVVAETNLSGELEQGLASVREKAKAVTTGDEEVEWSNQLHQEGALNLQAANEIQKAISKWLSERSTAIATEKDVDYELMTERLSELSTAVMAIITELAVLSGVFAGLDPKAAPDVKHINVEAALKLKAQVAERSESLTQPLDQPAVSVPETTVQEDTEEQEIVSEDTAEHEDSSETEAAAPTLVPAVVDVAKPTQAPQLLLTARFNANYAWEAAKESIDAAGAAAAAFATLGQEASVDEFSDASEQYNTLRKAALLAMDSYRMHVSEQLRLESEVSTAITNNVEAQRLYECTQQASADLSHANKGKAKAVLEQTEKHFDKLSARGAKQVESGEAAAKVASDRDAVDSVSGVIGNAYGVYWANKAEVASPKLQANIDAGTPAASAFEPLLPVLEARPAVRTIGEHIERPSELVAESQPLTVTEQTDSLDEGSSTVTEALTHINASMGPKKTVLSKARDFIMSPFQHENEASAKRAIPELEADLGVFVEQGTEIVDDYAQSRQEVLAQEAAFAQTAKAIANREVSEDDSDDEMTPGWLFGEDWDEEDGMTPIEASEGLLGDALGALDGADFSDQNSTPVIEPTVSETTSDQDVSTSLSDDEDQIEGDLDEEMVRALVDETDNGVIQHTSARALKRQVWVAWGQLIGIADPSAWLSQHSAVIKSFDDWRGHIDVDGSANAKDQGWDLDAAGRAAIIIQGWAAKTQDTTTDTSVGFLRDVASQLESSPGVIVVCDKVIERARDQVTKLAPGTQQAVVTQPVVEDTVVSEDHDSTQTKTEKIAVTGDIAKMMDGEHPMLKGSSAHAVLKPMYIQALNFMDRQELLRDKYFELYEKYLGFGSSEAMEDLSELMTVDTDQLELEKQIMDQAVEQLWNSWKKETTEDKDEVSNDAKKDDTMRAQAEYLDGLLIEQTDMKKVVFDGEYGARIDFNTQKLQELEGYISGGGIVDEDSIDRLKQTYEDSMGEVSGVTTTVGGANGSESMQVWSVGFLTQMRDFRKRSWVEYEAHRASEFSRKPFVKRYEHTLGAMKANKDKSMGFFDIAHGRKTMLYDRLGKQITTGLTSQQVRTSIESTRAMYGLSVEAVGPALAIADDITANPDENAALESRADIEKDQIDSSYRLEKSKIELTIEQEQALLDIQKSTLSSGRVRDAFYSEEKAEARLDTINKEALSVVSKLGVQYTPEKDFAETIFLEISKWITTYADKLKGKVEHYEAVYAKRRKSGSAWGGDIASKELDIEITMLKLEEAATKTALTNQIEHYLSGVSVEKTRIAANKKRLKSDTSTQDLAASKEALETRIKINDANKDRLSDAKREFSRRDREFKEPFTRLNTIKSVLKSGERLRTQAKARGADLETNDFETWGETYKIELQKQYKQWEKKAKDIRAFGSQDASKYETEELESVIDGYKLGRDLMKAHFDDLFDKLKFDIKGILDDLNTAKSDADPTTEFLSVCPPLQNPYYQAGRIEIALWAGEKIPEVEIKLKEYNETLSERKQESVAEFDGDIELIFEDFDVLKSSISSGKAPILMNEKTLFASGVPEENEGTDINIDRWMHKWLKFIDDLHQKTSRQYRQLLGFGSADGLEIFKKRFSKQIKIIDKKQKDSLRRFGQRFDDQTKIQSDSKPVRLRKLKELENSRKLKTAEYRIEDAMRPLTFLSEDIEGGWKPGIHASVGHVKINATFSKDVSERQWLQDFAINEVRRYRVTHLNLYQTKVYGSGSEVLMEGFARKLDRQINEFRIAQERSAQEYDWQYESDVAVNLSSAQEALEREGVSVEEWKTLGASFEKSTMLQAIEESLSGQSLTDFWKGITTKYTELAKKIPGSADKDPENGRIRKKIEDFQESSDGERANYKKINEDILKREMELLEKLKSTASSKKRPRASLFGAAYQQDQTMAAGLGQINSTDLVVGASMRGVTQRRLALGMSVDELASRSGLKPSDVVGVEALANKSGGQSDEASRLPSNTPDDAIDLVTKTLEGLENMRARREALGMSQEQIASQVNAKRADESQAGVPSGTTDAERINVVERDSSRIHEEARLLHMVLREREAEQEAREAAMLLKRLKARQNERIKPGFTNLHCLGNGDVGAWSEQAKNLLDEMTKWCADNERLKQCSDGLTMNMGAAMKVLNFGIECVQTIEEATTKTACDTVVRKMKFLEKRLVGLNVAFPHATEMFEGLIEEAESRSDSMSEVTVHEEPIIGDVSKIPDQPEGDQNHEGLTQASSDQAEVVVPQEHKEVEYVNAVALGAMGDDDDD